MAFIHLGELAEQEPVTGHHVRFVHSDQMTLAYWTIEADTVIPEHTHEHEQVTTILRGEFELTGDGETKRLGPREVAVIPSHAPQGGRAITDCRMIDVFHPVREDYR